MLTPIWLLSLATTPIGGPSIPPVSVESRPRVEVWTDRGDSPYTSGQGVRTHFRADRDAFVTILRVDTDGRVRVLFPREPWEGNFARGGRDYEVQSEEHTSELQSRLHLVCRLLLEKKTIIQPASGVGRPRHVL